MSRSAGLFFFWAWRAFSGSKKGGQGGGGLTTPLRMRGGGGGGSVEPPHHLFSKLPIEPWPGVSGFQENEIGNENETMKAK